MFSFLNDTKFNRNGIGLVSDVTRWTRAVPELCTMDVTRRQNDRRYMIITEAQTERSTCMVDVAQREVQIDFSAYKSVLISRERLAVFLFALLICFT